MCFVCFVVKLEFHEPAKLFPRRFAAGSGLVDRPMIASACEMLKRNREKYLLPRPTDEIVKILCEVGAAWLQPENHFRKLALELGPAETKFSRPVLERGLDGFFRQFTPENFQALLAQELGDGIAVTGDKWHVTGNPDSSRHPSPAHPSLLARPGISRPRRRRQFAESDADEPDARPAHALGAVRQMRERRVVPAAAFSRI